MSMEYAAPTDVSASLLRPGKDEMNFAEFPIALLTDRVPKGQKTIKFEDQVYDARRKKVITRRRVIEGSEEYGLPTATDDTVILALIQITKQKSNFAKRDIEFTRLELIKMLGWTDEGRSYDRIKLSLQRIANVTYNYDNSWWDDRQQSWTTRIFHILDTVEINDSRASNGQGGLFSSRIVWNEIVFDSFQAGFLRDIDFQLCMRLKHPTALRMYRFLGKRFYVKPDWEFDLKEFANDYMCLGRNYEGGTQIARKLQPAIEELENAEFLEPLPEAQRFTKNGRDWKVRFLKRAASPALPMPRQAAPAATGLAEQLVQRGVTRARAVALTTKYPMEMIAAKIDVFDWMTASGDKRIGKSPAGYLVKSIEDDYAAPKGFVSKAEREKQEAAKRESERTAAEAHRSRHEKAAREKAERDAIHAYWGALSPGEQAALDEAARALANPETLALETGPLKSLGESIRREEYIRDLLKARTRQPLDA
jgi:Replication initiator protein A